MTDPVPFVTAEDFDRAVLASDLPVLVDVGAAWCPPCRRVEPMVRDLAARAAGRLRVVAVDADASPELAARYRVRALPTLLVFAGGREVARHVGAPSAPGLDALVASVT